MDGHRDPDVDMAVDLDLDQDVGLARAPDLDASPTVPLAVDQILILGLNIFKCCAIHAII